MVSMVNFVCEYPFLCNKAFAGEVVSPALKLDRSGRALTTTHPGINP